MEEVMVIAVTAQGRTVILEETSIMEATTEAQDTTVEVLARDSAERMDNIKSTVKMLNIFETINYGVFRRSIVSILDVNTKKIRNKSASISSYFRWKFEGFKPVGAVGGLQLKAGFALVLVLLVFT